MEESEGTVFVSALDVHCVRCGKVFKQIIVLHPPREIEGLKQETEEALSENLEDLRAEEAAVMSFIQAKLAKLEA